MDEDCRTVGGGREHGESVTVGRISAGAVGKEEK